MSSPPPHPLGDPLVTVTPVVSRSAPAPVADQIVLPVREHRLRPDDRFPPEREGMTT